MPQIEIFSILSLTLPLSHLRKPGSNLGKSPCYQTYELAYKLEKHTLLLSSLGATLSLESLALVSTELSCNLINARSRSNVVT